MSDCKGPDCDHPSHHILEVDNTPPSQNPAVMQRRRSPRNTIVRRAFKADGSFYFRMGDGSLITPEVAIKRGLIDRAKYEQALAEERKELGL